MTYYFIADLHLNENQPEITDLFLQFMQKKHRLHKPFISWEIYLISGLVMTKNLN